MARKVYPYSLDRKDAKVAGVASTIGAMVGIDPTFVRIGFVAAAIFISFKLTLIAYAAIGIYLAVQKKKSMIGDHRHSDFDRMELAYRRRPAGSRLLICASASASSKRSPPESTFNVSIAPRALLPHARTRSSPAPFRCRAAFVLA